MSKEIQEEVIEDDDSINLLDYLIILAKRKKLILGITFTITILTVIYTLVLPNTYISKTIVLLPEQEKPSFGGLMGQFINVGGFSSSGLNDPFLYQQLLKSEPMYDRIIERFGLINYYKADTKKDVYEMLEGLVRTEFSVPEGRLTRLMASRVMIISFIDKDPEKAAEMTNAYVEEFVDFVRSIALTQTQQKRLFLEKQIVQVKEDLVKAENSLKIFQEEKGILKVDAQTQAMIESIANIRAQLILNEVELNVMKSYSTPNNPDVQRVRDTIDGLKIELSKLEKRGNNNESSVITTGEMPEVGTDFARKLRELKYQENLFEILSKQYEVAKIEEAQNPALIQILSKATPSQERVGPYRRKKVVTVFLLSLFFSIFWVFLTEVIEKYKNTSLRNRERIETLKRHISFRR